MYMYMHEIKFDSHQYFPGVCRLGFRGGKYMYDMALKSICTISTTYYKNVFNSIQNLNEYHHTFNF